MISLQPLHRALRLRSRILQKAFRDKRSLREESNRATTSQPAHASLQQPIGTELSNPNFYKSVAITTNDNRQRECREQSWYCYIFFMYFCAIACLFPALSSVLFFLSLL